MKNLRYLAFLSLTLIALGFAGCSDDDENGPGSGNISITVTGLTNLDANITVEGPNGFSETVTATTTLTDLPIGDYTVIVGSVSNQGQLFAVSADDNELDITVAADETETVSVDYGPAGSVIGIVGKWYSAGTDVAPLLFALFATDSIYAEFRDDNTYIVEQFDTTGAKLTLTGVYTQSASGTANIYDIAVDQTAPAALTSTGIFQVTSEIPDVMSYEIVQTSPDIGAIPPTASGGFGGTNGGAFGTTNVQTYRRVVE